ncbi:MAG: metalloregulator ArsR/SmtB family transcription factor [Proteobacteria bacterium]|jgi:ArsR family transcriptional regulator, lead/cadmium/zinc/bismuth-responsive transcriptional repressor|nr:metalloregulator ArsR/SmtB family transcription factor [Pseudomonadota bacterium]
MSKNDLVPQVADMFKLMGDPSRLRILVLCLRGKVSVGEIAEQLDLSPSLVSHHLRLLRAARLVRFDRQGKHVFYTVADFHIRQIVEDMLDHAAEEAALQIDRSAA